MNDEVLKVVDLYSKETKFADNLKDLINILSEKINCISNQDNSNDLLHKFYDPLYLDKIKHGAIEPILQKMVKENVKINMSTVHCSDDYETDEDVVEYEITYNLNNHKIVFHIHSITDLMIIHASIFIDDWLHFILKTHNGDIGWYQRDLKRGIQLHNEEKSELFYKEFNLENIYNDKKEFYTDLLRILFLCVAKYVDNELYDDNINF